jgi:hypothetical protein
LSSDVVVLRPVDAIAVVGGTWAVLLGVVVGAAAFLVGADENRALFWALVGAAVAVACIRAACRVRVEVTDTEITIVNFVGKATIPWSSVTEIDVVRSWLSPTALVTSSAAVRVTTLTGDRVVIDASTLEVPQMLRVLERFDPEARR